MRVSLNWLRDYVDISLPVAKLIDRLTLAGLEVAGTQVFGQPIPDGIRVKPDELGPVWSPEKVITAQVLKTEKHPNADKLKLVTVEYGAGQPKVVVTGAPNIKVGDVGQKVILGLSGTRYFDGHVAPKQIKELKPAEIRGVPSDSMLMSEYELGISEEHEGIIFLEPDAPVGKPYVDLGGDVVLEIDVLPNMARCLAMLGVAREVAAIVGAKVKNPPSGVEARGQAIDGRVTVTIADAKLSARYTAMLIEGITVGAAPGWMQRRLKYAGMRPINNIVDITNYVMLEWGQPLHAFDLDKLLKRSAGKPPAITVRPAKPGEVLVTLDKQKRELSPENLVIADGVGAIALAGVMGGLDTEVGPETKNVLLESASFDFVSIRRTMRQYNLPSEASARFSRGVHPEVVKPAAERAADLMRQHAKGTVAQGMIDGYPSPRPPQIVSLKLGEVKRLLGTDLPPLEVVRILQSLKYDVQQTEGETLRVTVPPNRLDIQEGPADLIEDLARIHGYDRLPATLNVGELPEQKGNRALALEEKTRDILVSCGLQEVITYGLTTPEREAPLGLPDLGYVTLLNPISSERVAMRRSVLAGVLEVAARNLKNTAEVGLFEVGPIYVPRKGDKLPDEPVQLALVLTGRRHGEFWSDGQQKSGALDFFDLKGVIEALCADLHLSAVSFGQAKVAYLHPGKASELLVNGQSAGAFGELHPKVAEAFDLAGKSVLAAELDLAVMLTAVPERFGCDPVPTFPPALRDIAVIVEEAVSAEKVMAEVRAAGGDLLTGVRLFDLYKGESIPEGTKSLAYALTYQALDRTLTDKEVDKAHKKIEDRLKHVLKAKIRGQ
jgi:phenylalanyl-tRNA synthetase beta chain